MNFLKVNKKSLIDHFGLLAFQPDGVEAWGGWSDSVSSLLSLRLIDGLNFRLAERNYKPPGQQLIIAIIAIIGYVFEVYSFFRLNLTSSTIFKPTGFVYESNEILKGTDGPIALHASVSAGR